MGGSLTTFASANEPSGIADSLNEESASGPRGSLALWLDNGLLEPLVFVRYFCNADICRT